MYVAKSTPDPAFVARQPRQKRSRVRVNLTLAAAEDLLLEAGLSAFSIPALAERLGCPRATIYKFFPTPGSLLNELVERHLKALEGHLGDAAERLQTSRTWRELVTHVVQAASEFYDKNPCAQIVLLVGPLSDSSFRALELTISRLGALASGLLAQRGLRVPEGAPDIAALAVEFGTASLRMSYFMHGRMTVEYTQAAADVILSFLERRIDAFRAESDMGLGQVRPGSDPPRISNMPRARRRDPVP